jgi:hypothetical protein
MPIWIHNYSQVRDNIDVFRYDTEPAVFPQYVAANPIAYNPNLFTNQESITVNGEQIPITVDFSGCRVGQKKYGDGGSVWCGDANQDGSFEPNEGFIACKESTNAVFPFCNAFWAYAKAGDQASCSLNNISISERIALYKNSGTINPPYTPHQPCESFLANSCVFDSYWADNRGYNPQPFKKIDPRISTNGKYWNNTNLWFSGSWWGDVLVENDGPKYGEPDGYEYAITVGHPITTSPCSTTLTFSYFDKELNEIQYREFECPCNAWGNPPNCISLQEDYHRLWVMKPDQEPIPDHIKRYKVLQGPIRNNHPTYGFHENYTITKVIHKLENGISVGIADRSKPFTFGVDPALIGLGLNYNGNEQLYFQGQGEDGGSVFTVTPEGETIYVGRHENTHGTKFGISNRDTIDASSCSTPDDVFLIAGDELVLNTRCALDIYHPNEISEESTTDIKLNLGNLNNYLSYTNDILGTIEKPKIKTYVFPEFIVNPDVNIENISDVNKKYPLKEVPYLSRESKNTFFENSNNIIFGSKKMLQASELNELQEKFYKNQSLFVEYVKNWITYSKIYGVDSLGFTRTGNSSINPFGFDLNKIIPLNIDMVKINKTAQTEYVITMNAGWYLLNSNLTLLSAGEGLVQYFGRYGNNDFIHLTENQSITINLNNITSFQTNLTTVNIKQNNIINCTNYEELKDNTNGILQVSPCGAQRNLLFFKELKNATYTSQITFNEPPSILSPLPPLPFYGYLEKNLGSNNLLLYTKTTGQGLSFYFANDVPIEFT